MRRLHFGFWRKLNAYYVHSKVVAKMMIVLLTLVVVTSMQSASAQIGSPFDLTPRLDTTKVTIPATQLPPNRMPDQTQASQNRNPFDLTRAEKDSSSNLSNVEKVISLPRLQGSSKESGQEMSRGTFDTILCFSLLVLLALAIVLQGGPLRRMFNAALSANMLSHLQRESRKLSYVLWATLGAILLGIFFFVTARHLYPNLTNYSWTTLGWFVLAAISLTGLKLLVLSVLKVIFPIAKPIETYQTLILVFAGVIGLCLFPALILICFGAPSLATGIAYVSLGLIAIGFLLRSLRALGNSLRYFTSYPFHFLLYLCGLEIGPLAVAFKLLTA